MIGKGRKIEREARRLYEPSMTPIGGICLLTAVLAASQGEWGFVGFGLLGASFSVFVVWRADRRWRDLGGDDGAESQSE